MNTEMMSQLTFLNTMVNDPIKYGDGNNDEVVVESAEHGTDPLAWLFKAMDWIYSSTLRTSRALLSA